MAVPDALSKDGFESQFAVKLSHDDFTDRGC